ncbi:fungal-specific transcription factor domain-containing protein, partial [Filobasidium floriforme]|uniref:fungal-specific transcription factor domain-containing protein n=1 Tax=Filobasidium floriforme TaxID=5210 RepID=UPI001E8DFA3B
IGGEMDFRRYLPRDVVISREEHDEALDQFFRYHASWGQQTHPVHFRTDMQLALSPASTSYSSSSARARTAHYSPMLHNAILSIGLRFLSHSSSHSNHDLSSLDTLRKFSDEAKKHMRTEGMNPSVATVQALAHLASHHNLMAEHNLGWLQIGMAVRCGLTLGLNVDPALLVRSGRLTEVQARDRNVTYWMTFVQEGLWAPYIGRPVNWPAHTTTPPSIDTNLDQLPWVAPSGRLALDSQPGMISSAFVETVKLMAIGDKILNTLYGITADLVALSRSGAISDIRRVGISSIRLHEANTIVLVASLSLSTWLEALPPALKLNSHSIRSALPHILTMHISWASFMIMLHKPFYRPLVNLPTTGNGEQPASNHNAMLAVKQCDRAAVQIGSLLQTWHKLHDLRFAPPCILESCFTAGTTHLLAYTCARTQRKQLEALARAKECTRLMETMAASWPAAQQKHELLEQLTAQYIAKNPPEISSEERDEGLKGHADPPVVDLAESFGTVNPYGSVEEPETGSIAPSAATPIQQIRSPAHPRQ